MSRIAVLKNRYTWIGLLAVIAVAVAAFTNGPGKADDTQAPARTVSVEVTPVAAGPLKESIAAVGTIAAMHDVVVSSETAGRITRVAVKVGDAVRAGQPLVYVDDELKEAAAEQARAQMLAAETSFKKARRDFERAETLFKSGDIADVELEGNRLAMLAAEAQLKGASAGLRVAERQLADTRIKSPISGVVASRKVDIGEMVSPGREIANVVDLSSLKVKLSIPEEEVNRLRTGQPAVLRVDSRPDATIQGSVYTVGSKTETASGHTYPVEVVVRSADLLKVGMFVRVELQTSAIPSALTISKESLVGDESVPQVYVVENNVARLRKITLGVRAADRYQVLDGLKSGELVVSFGQKGLKDGTPVQYK